MVRLYLALALATFPVACTSRARITLPNNEGAPGAMELRIPVRGHGTHFRAGWTTARFLGSSAIEVTRLEVRDNKHLDVFIDIPLGEPPGARFLEVSTGAEVAQAPFRVTGWPSVVATPPTVEQGAENTVISLTGEDTHFTRPGFAVESSFGEVAIESVEVVDDTTATISINVSPGAALGALPRGLMVTTDHQLLHVPLSVVRRPQDPAVQVFPAVGSLGTEVVVSINTVGTEYPPDPLAGFPETQGLEVINLVRLSNVEIQATLWLYSDASPGLYDLQVLTDAGWVSTTFEATAPTDPPTIVLSELELHQDSTAMLFALGTGTHFVEGQTNVRAEPEDAGVSFTLVGVPSPEQLQIEAAVAPNADVGEVQLIVETLPERIFAPLLIKGKPPKLKVSLAPKNGRQGETVAVSVTLQNGTWDPAVTVETQPGGGLTANHIIVDSPTVLLMDLQISDTAPTGSQDILFHTGGQTVRGKFRVKEGVPQVVITPDELPQHTQDALVVAEGRFLDFGTNPSVQVRGDCQVQVEIAQSSPDELILNVTVPFTQPLGACILRFETTDGHVDVVLTITEGVPTVPVPGSVTGRVSDDSFFRVELADADVLRARASRAVGATIDPVLELYDGDGQLVAENDDESAATYGSLIVFQAPEAASFFLHVRDRFGFNDGDYTIDLDWYAPGNALETDPITDPDRNFTRRRATSIGSVGSSILVRGRFQQKQDHFDHYAVPTVPGEQLAVSILAHDVSPYPLSTPDIELLLYQGVTGRPAAQATLGLEGLDPVLYLTPDGNEIIVRVRREPGAEAFTSYWLNVRPWVVINEFVHDEPNGWDASFVELHGEPDVPLDGCELRGQGHDGILGQTDLAFSIPLDGYLLGTWGYFVLAHDSLVPGAGSAFINSALVVDDLSGVYSTIAISLHCAGTVVDVVCYRGAELPICEGNQAPDTPGIAVGRGFKLDTDDNARDFLIQPEPSPWARNLREVR